MNHYGTSPLDCLIIGTVPLKCEVLRTGQMKYRWETLYLKLGY